MEGISADDIRAVNRTDGILGAVFRYSSACGARKVTGARRLQTCFACHQIQSGTGCAGCTTADSRRGMSVAGHTLKNGPDCITGTRASQSQVIRQQQLPWRA